MSMTFVGPAGSVERRWIVYAMLRDNVQHHLEGGVPTPKFEALHQLGDALWRGKVSVSASQLRAELVEVTAILSRSMDDYAVSLHTRAVCSCLLELPSRRRTDLAKLLEWTVPFPLEGAVTLADAFGSLHEELLRITEGATTSDVVDVIDT
ncbi:MAG: hypothetical protein ABI895_23795 [Deltaproteobacteria bacterium]